MSSLTILPPVEVNLFRSLRKTAIVLMVMFRLDQLGHSPALISEIATLLDMSRETVAGHLSSLAMCNLVARAGYHEGYLLTQGGRQWVLGSPENEQCRNFRHSDESLSKLSSSSLTLNTKLTTTTKSNVGNSDIAGELTITRVLEETSRLFTNPVLSNGLETFSPSMALAWVAQAYDNRDKLRAPWGIVYKGLKFNRSPRDKYIYDPTHFLPEDYLAALGLMHYICQICDGLEFPDRAALDAHSAEKHPEPEEPVDEFEPGCITADETVTQPLRPGCMDMEQAWQSALGQLQMEMPKASFDTWVRDTTPMHWEDGVLQIIARNAYARDWLESRLTSTVARLLSGICNLTVSVKFIVSVETEE